MAEQKEKIAILGGGLGSLITALELTSGVNAGKYEVSVYQNGWRLGGKGASGRNKAHHERIEEHGFHTWFGCYENAFRLFRAVLEEWKIPQDHPWNPGGPVNRWRYAFKTAGFSALTEKKNNGSWELWEFELPTRNNGEPGDGKRLYDGLWSLLGELLGGLMSFAQSKGVHRAVWDQGRPVKRGCLGSLWTLLTVPFRLFQLFRTWRLWVTLKKLIDGGNDTDFKSAARRILIVLDLGLAIGWGFLCNWWSISRHTLDALDGYEMREFLRKYGARDETVNSPVLLSIYDAIFAMVGGDPKKQNLAAGAGLRSMLRLLLGYKHSMFYKMEAGMGDTIFTPIYQVLQQRGVKIHLFHVVNAVELAEDRKSVARIRVGRQVTLKDPVAGYRPLVLVKGLDCWPSEPLWGQIVDDEAEALQKGGYNLEHVPNGWPDREEIMLRVRTSPDEQGDHLFDRVVLGIAIGAFPQVCPELIAANPRFKAMVDNVLTVRTEAYQVWLKTDLAGLGWKDPAPVFGGFIDPMNTWADLSHLLPREELPPGSGVRNLAYFCGPMPDSVPADDASCQAHVRKSVDDVLDALAQSFWPNTATSKHTFNTNLIDMEYLRWNVTPWERYVLTVAGSTQYRLWPHESGFSNVTLAGDWTRNGWNVGCVEATVMSGMLASNAISGYPEKSDIAYVNGP